MLGWVVKCSLFKVVGGKVDSCKVVVLKGLIGRVLCKILLYSQILISRNKLPYYKFYFKLVQTKYQIPPRKVLSSALQLSNL